MKSYSQLKQDFWVLSRLNNKRSGYFVEAGACDGIYLSNTYLLEKEFEWNGICCEPNPDYLEKLKLNRNCNCDHRVLYDVDNMNIEFYSAGEEGGTKQDFLNEPKRLSSRSSAPVSTATTITLNSLLQEYNAPKDIDYISLDTEGSELRILQAFDFDSWNVNIFTVEHNTQHRDDETLYADSLIELLEQHGYSHQPNRWDMYFYKV